MRIPLAFVTTVAAILTIGALADGDGRFALAAGAVTLVAGVFLLRSLRDPAAGRAAGLRAEVSFTSPTYSAAPQDGTPARVRTHRGSWQVTLRRVPERGDLKIRDVAQRGWLWLDPDGLPEKVRISSGTSWKTWPVAEAAEETTEGPRT